MFCSSRNSNYLRTKYEPYNLIFYIFVAYIYWLGSYKSHTCFTFYPTVVTNTQ